MTPADQHALREALAFARFEETHERRRADNWRTRALAAEAENTRLKETVEAMEAALKPFADEAVRFDSHHEELALPDEMILPAGLTLGHARAARSVLATIPPKENPDA